MIRRGYCYKLAPTPEQEVLFGQFAGVCRLIYNCALEQRRDHWRNFRANTGVNISYPSQARELTALRAEFEWIAAVSQTCQQQALRDLDRAFQNWFKGLSRHPTPRKKGRRDMFRFQGREIQTRKLNGKWSEVRLPKIGWIRYRDTRAIVGTISNATISLKADGWHISFGLEIAHESPVNTLPSVGIDRGISNTLALSTGERFSVPSRLLDLDQQIRRVQRVLSRRRRGSKRHAKTQRRISALSATRARIRRDWHHRISISISRRFGTVVLEDLKVGSMTASARQTLTNPGRGVRQKSGLNRSILNQGWHLFETLLSYKLEERGGHLCKVPAPYTSQTCAKCGAVDSESRENQASFHCGHCGHTDHADINAATVILRRNTASMLVEEGRWPTVDARTGGGLAIPENPARDRVGRC